MSARRIPILRSTATRIAVAAVAVVASGVATAPTAFADDDIAPVETSEPSESGAEAPADPVSAPSDDAASDDAPSSDAPPSDVPSSDVPTDAAPSAPDPSAAEPTPESTVQAGKDEKSNDAGPAPVANIDEDVTPVYGDQKFRVGVQVADGSWVPAGTTGAGSTFEITFTPQSGGSRSVTCTVQPANGGQDCYGPITAQAGESVTIVQTAAAPGLVKAANPQTLAPCIEGDLCDDFFVTQSVTFTNTGVLPTVQADAAKTTVGEAVTIDVLGNDDSEDPDTVLTLGAEPGDGTAKIVGSPAVIDRPQPTRLSAAAVPTAGTLAIEYTPDAGFVGTDTFTYRVTNTNGTTTGTVTVVVEGPDVDEEPIDEQPVDEDTTDVTPISNEDDDDAVASGSGSENAALPNTGGADPRLLGLGGLLLAGGAIVTATSRRRPQHASLVD